MHEDPDSPSDEALTEHAARHAAEEPAGDPVESLVEELESTGRRLVESLTAQLADGQVETIYTLQTAAAQVRKHTAAVTGATTSLSDSLARLTDKVAAEVQRGFAKLLQEAHASIGEQLAAEVDASSAELRGAAQDHATTVATQLELTSTHLTALYDAAVARTQDARQGLEWVAQQGAEQLAAAAATLKQHRTEGETILAAAGETLAGQVREAGSAAQKDVSGVVDTTLRHLRDGLADLIAQTATARDELDAQLRQARKVAEQELAALRDQIQAAERREASVAERLQQHVEELVARTDKTVAQSLTHLRAVADALLERDAQLEARRADEFARVLQVVLSEGGASTRRLRDRIFRGMDAAKQQPAPKPAAAAPPPPPARPRAEVPAPPAAPAAEPPVKAVPEPPAPAVPKKAAAKKAPAKKAAPTKAPAKKAPAKKAAPKKTAPKKTPAKKSASTPPSEPTPVQEEQA